MKYLFQFIILFIFCALSTSSTAQSTDTCQGLYQASDTITRSGLIPIGNDVIFDAGVEINLLPNFEVEQGALFEILLDACN